MRCVCLFLSQEMRCAVCRYRYPAQRIQKDKQGRDHGVAGTMELLCRHPLTEQPIAGFDWSDKKLGLFCCGAMDQCVRVGMATRLNSVG